MSRTVLASELVATKPGEADPFVTIPGFDIQSVDVKERIQDAMDTGSISIENQGGFYSDDDQQITSGDKLVYRVQLEGEDSMSDRWVAVARNPTDTLQGATRQALDIEATDFVFTILSWRLAYNTFDGVQIAGSDDAIVNRLLATEAPEIATDQIVTVDEETDLFANGRSLMDLIVEDLGPVSDAVVGNDGESLVFEPISDVSVKHSLSPTDFRGAIDISRADDRIANVVRVDGGTDHDSDAEQAEQTGYERVTNEDRLMTPVPTRKSEIDRVLVHVGKDPTSSDGITVRLQADRDGAPVAVDDNSSDLARRTQAEEFLATDGLTTFILPAHTLAPNEYPWLIIEADGPTGHSIGVSSTGVPTYRAEYPYPLLARTPNAESQNEYRRRDHRIKDDSIDSFEATRAKGLSYSRHHAEPERTVSGNAETLRAHRLKPGEGVDMTDWPAADIGGKWLCRQRTTSFSSSTNRLTTTLTLQDAATI